MGQSYFVWKGIDCRSLGVKLSAPVPIVRPEERVQHIEIPGRSGDLTLLEGEYVYNSYIQTATIQVKGGFHVRDVFRWLRGSGYVTFSGEPDRRQPARIIGAVTLDKHSHNIDTWVGEVQFYCQPLKEKLIEEQVTITGAQDVYNYGDVISRPRFAVVASDSTIVLTVGARSISMTDATSGVVYIFDSETMEVTDNLGTTQLTMHTVGSFPLLDIGATYVTGSGWSTIVIDKRERFL